MGTAHQPSKVIGFTTEDTEPPEIDTEKMHFRLSDLCALCGEIETVIGSIFGCDDVREFYLNPMKWAAALRRWV